ncbi:MAG: amino acid adenylation domain-containing protein [Bacteroidetes bacterium]|nr:amino acid adenylation domain-containing protein [Bacteroidota bacterium]
MSTIPPGYHFEAVDFDPFGSSTITVPSTEVQKEMFMSVLLGGDPANCAYNESITLHLQGPVQKDKLKEAFRQIIVRHESLRSTFSEDGLLMHVLPSITLPWREMANLDTAEKAAILDKYAREATLHVFDLINGPLVNMLLLHFNDNSHALLITGHHIVCDGWSLSLMIKDLSTIYSSLVKNEQPDLETAISFISYANEQEHYLKSKEHEEVEKFWLDQYQGELPVVEFPPDNHRPTVRSFFAKRIDVIVPPELVNRLRQLSRKSNTSFVTIMLSSFETFLYRVTGQEDLVVGLPAAGQNVEGYYNLIGHCVNLLPLRSKIKPEQSFSDYLKDRKSYLFDAYDHQQFTFGSLLQKLSIQRDPSRIPLVPVVFNVDIGFTEGFSFEGCTFDVSTNPRHFENFEIFLNASGSGDRLVLECTFNNDLFDEDMMRLRMEEYVRLMTSIADDPNCKISHLELRTEEEKAFLNSINDTDVNFNKPSGIHECIDQIASTLKPSQTAVVARAKSMTYRELSDISDRWASRLQKKGLKEGDFVGVCLPRTIELPAVLVSILKAGGAYVPLDPAFPADRLQYMVEDSNASLIIITRELQDEFHFPEDKIIYIDALISETNGSTYTKYPVTKDSIAYVLYTSGSTGKPKGVVIKHHGVVSVLSELAGKFGMSMEDRFLAITTISFDISVLEIFMPLMHGASVHLTTKEESFDPIWLEDYINKNSIRFIQGTPATFEILFSAGWKGNNELVLLCGGEAMRIELVEKVLYYNKEIWNLYGPTEATIWATVQLFNNENLHLMRNGAMSIGKPIANTRVFIMDANGQPCPLGVSGELWIGGEGVALEYKNLPEMTREKFIPSPDNNGRVYRTGDRVVMDQDGYLHFMNRFDHQVKVRGYRIELGEIETNINECHGLAQCVVMTVPDATGSNMLAVWFTTKEKNIDEKAFIQKCKKALALKLPDYMIPTLWMKMDSFPLTPNRKIDRKALPKQSVGKPVERIKSADETLTPLQLQISKVWKDTLHVSEVTLDDNFFEQGGYSILAVKLMVDLEKETGIRLPIAVLFTHSTIRKLSSLYDKPAEEDVWSPIVTIKEEGKRKPMYFVHGVSGNVFKYFALGKLLHPDQPSLGLQGFGLNGKDIPFTNMEEMAAYHIEALLKFQPNGPYMLGGGSFGGYLAYEMAIQLMEKGKEVSFLALYDLDAAKKTDFLPGGVKQLMGATLLASRFIKRATVLAKADKEERKNYFEARKKIKEVGELESWLDIFNVTEMIGEDAATYFKRVEEACYEALMNYKIKPYKGSLVLFRAKDGHYNNEYDEDLGWGNFVKGKTTVITVPGDHNTIFEEPNVPVLAAKMNEILNKMHG